MVFVYGKTEPDEGLRVLRARPNGDVEVGQLRSVREGQPIHGELVRLEQRPEHAQLFDVDVLLEAPSPSASGVADDHAAAPAAVPQEPAPTARRPRAGPPQVASPAYRRNWDRIFGAWPTTSKKDAPN
ncbi:MAG: hypothetical protein HY908_13445 [Myxococcales bacterium]|nr:hypothetical protein [Myxococcales bacterium]